MLFSLAFGVVRFNTETRRATHSGDRPGEDAADVGPALDQYIDNRRYIKGAEEVTSTTAAAFPGVRQILWTTRKKQDIIKNVTARIIARHPDAPLTLVARVVAEEYDQLASSPIRTYTPMLIERGAPKRINKSAAHKSEAGRNTSASAA